MKHRSMILGAIVFGAIGMMGPKDAEADGVGANPTKYPAAPHLKLNRSIDVRGAGSNSWVQILRFSPDSRYLAIGATPTASSSAIVVWDLQLNREQSRVTELPPFASNPQVEILWSPDGKSITFGTGTPIRFWDPLTGQVVKELADEPPHLWARYNRDGSKFLVNREPLGGNGSFRIYDTGNWQFRDYSDDGLHIQALSWTADDKVLVSGEWPKVSAGRALDGLVPQAADTLVRLIDPSGRQPSHSVVLSSATHSDLKGNYSSTPLQSFWPDWAVVNFATNKVALGLGKIIDGRTLEGLTYASPDDIISGKIPSGGLTFSPDGNYLYLLGLIGIRRADSIKSFVMDARTRVMIATFPAGQNGLAASPDGKRIAVGNGRSVDLYDVQ